MGEQLSNQPVAEHMTRLLEGLGYQGVVDAGLRFDARDGEYKLLDVNPRVGQAFRMFLSEDGTDVVRAMYLDLTGQPVGELVAREGRRWAIEDFELYSLIDYWREGSWPLGKWLASYRGVEELAWWSLRDPWPFAVTVQRFLARASRYILKRIELRTRRLLGRGASGTNSPAPEARRREW
jgi:predicted ATP-grasp superfamily ATP-dependent carboligase